MAELSKTRTDSSPMIPKGMESYPYTNGHMAGNSATLPPGGPYCIHFLGGNPVLLLIAHFLRTARKQKPTLGRLHPNGGKFTPTLRAGGRVAYRLRRIRRPNSATGNLIGAQLLSLGETIAVSRNSPRPTSPPCPTDLRCAHDALRRGLGFSGESGHLAVGFSVAMLRAPAYPPRKAPISRRSLALGGLCGGRLLP